MQLIFNPILSRIVAAIVGGFLLASLLSILLSYGVYSFSPTSKVDGVNTGALSSFLFYAMAIVWVFAAKTAWQAWLGLLIPALISAVGIFMLRPEGLL